MRPSLFMLLIVVTTATASLRADESRPPNVVFILVDDLGWSDVGYNGSGVYETPNVDRLASQGMVLSDFYSGGPVCSPTRASIMTGKYTARTRITTYLLSPDRDAKHLQSHLPLEEFTIAEAFEKNGFATGYFGKWHLGYEDEYWAGNQGFQVAKGGMDLPWAWTLCYPDIDEAPTAKTWPKTHTRFFSPYHLTHLKNGPEGEYLTERLTNETIEFIEHHRSTPFFAFLSFHTVHTPLQAKPEKIEKYRQKIAALGLDSKQEKNGREKAFQSNAAYAAMVEHMDENVGRLLARLDELQLSDNTIVVWTSDNGGKGSVTSNLPLRGMKHNLYEGGIRVPTIVRWPSKIAAGSNNATPLISNDFYPTLLELTGRKLEPQQHMDGVSFADVLLGRRQSVDRDAIYWHYPHGRQEAAVREGNYKLLHRFEQDSVELYDLHADVGERKDLSDEMPEVAGRLLGKLKSWQESVDAKYPGDIVESPRPPVSQGERPNVLFISVDDWNDWVGCLGHKQARTPNVDRLARRGLLFRNAHCVAPVCNPSRVSTLTGLRPETTKVYENATHMRKHLPDVVTLPHHFRMQGYHVVGGGKVFHDPPPHNHDPRSWDDYFWWNEHGPKGGRAGNRWRSPYSIPPDPQPEVRPANRITGLTKRNFDWGAVDQSESNWPDFKVATWAMKFLQQDHDKPFFLSVGFFRPHVPWFNPRKYVDQYPLDEIQLPPVKTDDLQDLGKWARARAVDANSQHDKLVEFDEWKVAVQAYLASISFADANVGRVLDALDKSKYRDNTIIVFWSDHGYHLGEKSHWHKRTLWERATHVPLIVAAPGVTDARTQCDEAVSLLDIYPTLSSLCGLPLRRELEGNDLTPLLKAPQSKWEHAAVTTYRPGNHSVRSRNWRYIRYGTGEEELYDHRQDPNEWDNLAAKPQFAQTKIELARHLPRQLQPGRVDAAPAPVKTLTFLADGRARGLVSAGDAWKMASGKLVGGGKPNRLYASHGIGTGDFHVDATLSLDKLNGTAAAFEIGTANFFGFEGARNEFYLNGRIFGGRRRLMPSKEHLVDGKPFRFQAIRKAGVIRFLIDDTEILKINHGGPLDRLAFSPARATMRIERFVVTGGLVPAANLPHEDGSADSELPFATVFAHGRDGYSDYRIPALVTTRDGTLIAFAEGRQTLSDHARNDIVAKRSTDNGKSWGPLIHVHQDDESVLVNPCAVVLESGRVMVMYQRFPNGYHARAIGKSVKLLEPGLKGSAVSTTLISSSDDDGKTWSKPRDVTRGTKRAEKINSTATGPGRGIVLMRGDHKGRIIMPTNEGWWEGRDRFFNVYACHSDDGGETWHYGESAPNGDKGQGNEVQMVELSDGSIMLNTRNHGGSGFRKTAISKDGGQAWSPLVDVAALAEPRCMGSILRYSFGTDKENRLLFANPNSQQGRKNGTVRMSFDDGKTWPVARTIYPGSYAYSCLTRLADGSVGLVFEADGYQHIKFVNFDLKWLTSEPGEQE